MEGSKIINRYSSRREDLFEAFFNRKINEDTINYYRIAGYFSSSIMEIAKEPFEKVQGTIKIICNSNLSIEDVKVAKAVEDYGLVEEGIKVYIDEKLKREWNINRGILYKKINNNTRYEILHNLLKSKKVQIRFVPKEFGFLHSKLGIIEYEGGSSTCFVGSVNETFSAWKTNYEVIWEDNSNDSVQWSKEEFDYFWSKGIPLGRYIIDDIYKVYSEKKIRREDWIYGDLNPGAILNNTPLYKEENGLLDHQIHFVQFAFNEHLRYKDGARLILADEVGLGKTLQLAAFAMLVGVYGNKPVMIIVPKTLQFQWQEEMYSKLNIPSAVWRDNKWITEENAPWRDNNENYNNEELSRDILRCPRKIAIISQGLIIISKETRDALVTKEYDAVLVDEAHKARRKDFRRKREENINILMQFLEDIAVKTKSMILATATPIQIDKVELIDLLLALSKENESVLGNSRSYWRKVEKKEDKERIFEILTNTNKFKTSYYDWKYYLQWFGNPLLPSPEHEFIDTFRRKLGMQDNEYTVPPQKLEDLYYHSKPLNLMGPMKNRLCNDFMANHNPITYHIFRRTRENLEKRGILKAIEVRLKNKDSKGSSIPLTKELQEAYILAEIFCQAIHKRTRKKGAGFTKTLLLRRLNSSLKAGYNTTDMLLHKNIKNLYDEDSEDENVKEDENLFSNMTEEELEYLRKIKDLLEMNYNYDPKYQAIIKTLKDEEWYKTGCILFSQYYDTAEYIFENLIKDFPGESIAIYAGSNKSKLYSKGVVLNNYSRDIIKSMVSDGKIRLLIGTDAASEGLNLQTMQNLINIDMPYNPTKLEQRKGRIQRPGQKSDFINIYNLRYKDSIDDRVHQLLMDRFKDIQDVFGKIPDVVSDVWIDVALAEKDEVEKEISEFYNSRINNKFDIKEREVNLENKNLWKTKYNIVDEDEILRLLKCGWS